MHPDLPIVLLRRPVLQDEAAVRAACRELAGEGIDFAPRVEGMSWDTWLRTMRDREAGRDLPPGIVPETFLLAFVGADLVGRGSVRHRLTPRLELVGGHIGYAVRPGRRRRGYATAILRGGLDLLRGSGIACALVTCGDDNAASATVIERAGGVLRDLVLDPEGRPTRRYDVPTGAGR